MRNMTSFIFGLFGTALGGSVLLMGKHALLSQATFLRLYNKWQKTAQFGLKPFDVGHFGGPSKLRLIGLGLSLIGLFIIVSVCAILFNRFR
ncbi:MAG: hypothetical protein DMG79_19880 [Acidobacteria bacterium]|nr:MAG: hypothetical protein DMG79_19880 [Acidobacteriota bacterium]